ncbi:MAG: stp 4, partial [Nocardioidaceae bacterium]|nr:stp 4 [Nocardioidaceae bacterium]
SGGQVHAAAEGAQQAAAANAGAGAGQQAFDLVTRVGTSAVVDALNNITLIAAILAFAAGLLCLVLIRQKDFVVRGGPPAAAAEGPGAGVPAAPAPNEPAPVLGAHVAGHDGEHVAETL